MPTIKEFMTRQNREAADAMIRTVSAMPPEKTTWKPLDEGRSVLDLLIECGAVNQRIAEVLQEMVFAPPNREAMTKLRSEIDTPDQAFEHLRMGTDALIASINQFPEDRLDETLDIPFRGGMTRTFAEIMMIPLWNMGYHIGQINYIQTLYGDKEMH